MCKMKIKINIQGMCILSCRINYFFNSVRGDQPYHVAKDKASGMGLGILYVQKLKLIKT